MAGGTECNPWPAMSLSLSMFVFSLGQLWDLELGLLKMQVQGLQMGSVLPQQQLLLRLLILLLLLLLLPLLVLLHCARKRSAPFGTKVLPILVNLANLGGSPMGQDFANLVILLAGLGRQDCR